MTTLKDKQALNKAKQSVERLKSTNKTLQDEKTALQKENAGLRSQIPTFKDKLAQNEQKIKITDLTNRNNYLESLLNRILAALPEKERQIVENLINPPKQRRSRDVDR